MRTYSLSPIIQGPSPNLGRFSLYWRAKISCFRGYNAPPLGDTRMVIKSYDNVFKTVKIINWEIQRTPIRRYKRTPTIQKSCLVGSKELQSTKSLSRLDGSVKINRESPKADRAKTQKNTNHTKNSVRLSIQLTYPKGGTSDYKKTLTIHRNPVAIMHSDDILQLHATRKTLPPLK